MRKDLISALIAVLAFTLLLGVAYPLVITGISQVAFGGRADGSLTTDADGKVNGSRLIGRDFSRPVKGADGKPRTDADGEPVTEPDPQYFQGRPSATGYSASATGFSNRPPNSAAARFFYRDQLRAYLALNGADSPGLKPSGVPADAVTTSGSGVDPQISEANARIQAARVARVRGISPGKVAALVADHTDGRSLGVFGEPGVVYSALNDALDQESR